jgi:hypothetical protein
VTFHRGLRGLLPAVIGGAVALSVGAATVLTLTSGGHQGGGAAPGAISDTGAASAAGGNATAGSAGTAVTLPAAGTHVVPDSRKTAVPWATATLTTPASSVKPSIAQPGSPPRQLVVPDIIAAVPGGISAAQAAGISRLGNVRAVLLIDGARITLNGRQVSVLAAPASRLRPWTPPATAASTSVWSRFAAGDFIASSDAASGLGMAPGQSYQASAGIQEQLTYGAQALLGVPGVDGIVNSEQASRLGLVKNVAVLINAPAARLDELARQVKQVVGASGQVVRLVPESVSTHLPVDTKVPTGRPANYLMLYQESAAQYCPGLSWTVLAAIGEIESNNGQNMGPSSAGALGPMQFLPSTWAQWGITAFGNTGKPDIMDPFDAVPSAARMLCASGAGSGGQSLSNAIFAYNHADWYVNEVLTLAGEYAREYG